MEFEILIKVLGGRLEHFAAAFGVEEFEIVKDNISSTLNFQGNGRGGLTVMWSTEYIAPYLWEISVGHPNTIQKCYITVNEEFDPDDGSPSYFCGGYQPFRGYLAKGLYCLGFTEENALVQLNHSLTDHDKLELRLSMPREFWPKTWLDEEVR